MTPRSIFLFAKSFERTGGVENHSIALADALRSQGHRVFVLVAAGKNGGGDPELTVVPGVADPHVASAAADRVAQLVAAQAPDVVHAHGIPDQCLLQRLRRLAPLVQSVHEHQGCFSGGLKYFTNRRVCHRAHGPACVIHALTRNCGHRKVPLYTPAMYQRTSRRLEGLRASDAVVAYSDYMGRDLRANGIERCTVAKHFAAYPVSSPDLVPQPGRLLFAGRVVPAKGVEILVRSLLRLPQARLEIQGDGWGMPKVRRLTERLALTDRIDFRGWGAPADLAAAYQRASVVVVPSILPEGFGLVGLEAMTYSRPVVGSRVGGIPEWLTDGVTGELVPQGDPAALARAVGRLLDDPLLAARYGRAGRERALDVFSIEKHLDALDGVYADAVVRWRGHRPAPVRQPPA